MAVLDRYTQKVTSDNGNFFMRSKTKELVLSMQGHAKQHDRHGLAMLLFTKFSENLWEFSPLGKTLCEKAALFRDTTSRM